MRGIKGDFITPRVNAEVAKALKSREGGIVSELESLTGKDVLIESDASLHQERFEIYQAEFQFSFSVEPSGAHDCIGRKWSLIFLLPSGNTCQFDSVQSQFATVYPALRHQAKIKPLFTIT
jgi:hypothetical protein